MSIPRIVTDIIATNKMSQEVKIVIESSPVAGYIVMKFNDRNGDKEFAIEGDTLEKAIKCAKLKRISDDT